MWTLLEKGLLDPPPPLPFADFGFDCGSTSNNNKRKMLLLLSKQHREPQPKYKEHRRNGAWEEHLAKCLYKRGEFQMRYHMTKEAFDKLVDLLDIQVDHKQSRCSTGGIEPIDVNIIVACGLRWLGGESHKTNADAFHISIPSSKRVVRQFIEAVIQCPALAITKPTHDELEDLAAQTTKKSSCDGCFHGCVLMVDGFLSPRNKPSDNEVTNPADYYSGHKKTFGVNVQAVCDHTLRFRFVCVAAPGKTNDHRAFGYCTTFLAWLEALPSGYFIVGDNAYPLSNKILTPFKGRKKVETYNSSFNFYLSQLRIRIEMAFGRMTTKFRIMRTKMTCSLEMQSKIIQAVTRLHNFVIDADGATIAEQPVRLDANGVLEASEVARLGIDPLPNNEDGNLGFVSVPYETEEEGTSARRVAIVEQLRQKTIQRPLYNLQRNT